MRRTIEHVDTGTPGVRQKLRRLRDLVENAKTDPAFRTLAIDVVRNVRQGDVAGELAAVSQWVRDRVTYRRDPVGVELFIGPELLARQALDGIAAGDCDDHVALGAALAEVLGHPSRFVVGGDPAGRDTLWSHIWRETYDSSRGRWIPFDDTAKRRPGGWSPANRYDDTLREQPMRRTTKVGLPVFDDTGRCIPGLAVMSEIDVTDGIGRFRRPRPLHRQLIRHAKRVHSAVGLSSDDGLGRGGIRRITRRVKKLARKALPVAALLANAVPGVGTVASVALTAAAAQQRQRQQNTRARRAAQAAGAAGVAIDTPTFSQQTQSLPLPMPDPLISDPSQAGVVVQAPIAPSEPEDLQPMPSYSSPEPQAAQDFEPPPAPPAQPWLPAWDDAKQSDGLNDFFSDVMQTAARSLQTGTLTVGGVSVPLGRDARRVLAPAIRLQQAIRPAVSATPGAESVRYGTAAPPAFPVFSPLPGLPTTRRATVRSNVRAGTRPRGGGGGGGLGAVLAIGGGIAAIMLLGGRR